jgi:hypothetical protein
VFDSLTTVAYSFITLWIQILDIDNEIKDMDFTTSSIIATCYSYTPLSLFTHDAYIFNLFISYAPLLTPILSSMMTMFFSHCCISRGFVACH